MADIELISIISTHYLEVQGDPNKKTITYRDLIYRKELIGELNSLVSDRGIYKSVRNVLLYVNFNHLEFFKYLIDKLQEEYNKLETLEAKLELLKYQRKQFRQMLIKPNFALFFQLPTIKEQILNWVEEEIIFMESQTIHLNQEPEKKVLKRQRNLKLVWAYQWLN